MGELIVSIAAHAVLGIALALVVWALGSGWLRLGRRLDSPFAYPVGMLAACLAGWVVLVSAWLVPIALLLLAPALLAVRPRYGPIARATPFALGLGLALGSLLHGPTEDQDSHAYTDMLVYAAKLSSARESVLPFRDLLVAGERNTYLETGSTFVGAAIPFVDPILFQAAAIPAFLVVALAAGFARQQVRLSSRHALALGPLAAAVVAYPTWVTESPPAALALPLAFSLYTIARAKLPLGDLAFGVTAVGVAFVLTKGLGAVSLAVATAFAVAGLRGRVETRRVLAVAAPIAFVGATVLAVFLLTSSWLAEVLALKFLPAEAVDGLRSQADRRSTQELGPAFLIAGQLLLAALLATMRAWSAFAFLAVATVGTWLVAGHGFDIGMAIAVAVSLLALAERPERVRTWLPLLVLAASALALSAVVRDISGVRAGVVFVVLLGGGVVAALVSPRQALAVGAAVAACVAAGYADGSLARGPVTLTAEHYDVWQQVRERVDRHDLVFTSETGPALGLSTQGWNYYPGIAGRQIYLAGWSSSPLLVDEDERERRLQLNQDVLAGRREPSGVAPGYERYFSVVRRGEGFVLAEIP